MALKIRLRRITGNANYPEPADLAEPFVDALYARLGFDFGGTRPRWYPRVDASNNLIMDGDSVIKGANAEGDNEINDTYIGFGEPGVPFVERIRVVANNRRVLNIDPTSLNVLQDLKVTGDATVGNLQVDGEATFSDVIRFEGEVEFAGGTNLEFGDAILPAGSEEYDFLTAGPSNTRAWKSPTEVLYGTSFAGMILAAAQEPGFNIDVRSECYALLVDTQGPTGYIAPNMSDFANLFPDATYTSSFTRNSVAYRTNRPGVVESVAVNTSRTTYDTYTKEKQGLRLEGASANMVVNKGTFGAVVGTGALGVLPTGRILENIPNASKDVVVLQTVRGVATNEIRFHGINSTGAAINMGYIFSSMEFPVTPGELWTGSIYFQFMDTTNMPASLGLRVRSQSSVNGAVIGSPSDLSLLPFLSGWQRKGITHTVQGASDRISLMLAFTVGAGASYDFSMRLGGPQLEKLPIMSSLILNVDNIRARENLILPATEPMLRNDEGTVVIYFRPKMITANHPSSTPTLWYASDDPTLATNANALHLMWDRSSNLLRAIARRVNTTVADMNVGTLTQDTLHKVAFGWKTNDFAAKLDANAIAVDTTGASPGAFISQSIGSNGSTQDAFVDIMKFQTFRRRLSNAEMTTLTAA